MIDYTYLNSKQIEGVQTTEGPFLILAGAGSGKTTVLINRILFILENNKAKPWQILAITFTNKAADELKNRLESKLGDEGNDIWAMTFHSACVRILRLDADRIGYGKNFNIYDTADSTALLKQILKDFNYDEKIYPPKTILGEISRSKDANKNADAYCSYAKSTGDFFKQKVGEIYKEYQRRMIASNSMDFDDLIFNVVKLFQSCPEVKNYWQDKFRYVMIDEYQDTNHLQYLFTSLIVNKNHNICVVGDDDQSIYKFRGATIENILSFEDEYPGCKVIRLEQNYRSTSNILNAANNVIRNNSRRKGKELWTNSGEGDKLELYVAENEREEARIVSSVILNGVGRGDNFRDYAILYRMNAQSNVIEDFFKRNSIPYKIIGGIRYFDRAEVKDCLSYLSVIASANDDLRLQRIINNPARGIGAKSIDTAREIAYREGKSLFDVVKHADEYPDLSRSAIKMREFSVLIDQLRDFSAVNTPEFLFDEMLEKTGYLKQYEDKNDPECQSKIENINELKSSIIGYMQDSEDTTLDGYLASVALYSDLDNYEDDKNCVVLMTMHSSKGLEFPNVFIVGMEESIFPGIRAIGMEEEMEEERRLCYVAITRAKKKLNLICTKQRMLYGKTQSNRVSRFVDEIPEEYITKNIPKGYSYSDKPSHSQSYEQTKVSTIKPNFTKSPTTEIQNFAVGDAVAHKAFGKGTVTAAQPMGNDVFLTIHFDSVGDKKFMQRAAGKFMQKI